MPPSAGDSAAEDGAVSATVTREGSLVVVRQSQTVEREGALYETTSAVRSMSVEVGTTNSKGEAGYTLKWEQPFSWEVLMQQSERLAEWDEHFYTELYPGGKSKHRDQPATERSAH